MSSLQLSFSTNISRTPTIIKDDLSLDIDSLPKDDAWSYRFSEGSVRLKKGGKLMVTVIVLLYCESHITSLYLLINNQPHSLTYESVFTNHGDNYSLFYGSFDAIVDDSVKFTLSKTNNTTLPLITNESNVSSDCPRFDVDVSEILEI